VFYTIRKPLGLPQNQSAVGGESIICVNQEPDKISKSFLKMVFGTAIIFLQEKKE